MRKVKLGDVVDVLDSKRVPVSAKDRANRNKVYPYYGAQGIVDYIDDYLFDGDYILVAEDGNNLKSLNEPIVTWATGKFWVNNHANILGAKKGFSLRYIFYKLLASDLRGQITGSTQPKLNQKNLVEVVVEIPDYEEQLNISALLNSIDSKIDTNNKIIAELESLARTVCDYWFTQFDFPDEHGNPYRSSGGPMVHNPILNRDIPKGWEVGQLGTVLSQRTDSVIPNENPKAVFKYYSIPDYDATGTPSFVHGRDIQSGKYRVTSDDLLLSKLNPQFPRLWDPFCESMNSVGSTEFIVLRPIRAMDKAWCWSLLNSRQFKAFMIANAVSSTGSRSRIQPETVMAYSVPLPPSNLRQQYSIRVNPMVSSMKKIRQESARLASLRDWLLPMLMNGQAVIG